ncbi:hypothetical protein DPEC_G00231250 [Dallia pectoralis]|uniref:Uncharacterized protein n=1 Tax=Dallia pectoralis TaxID=75939 RepID=A0ACC2FX10_DALPE|nr:hypothetical protein DPEC_G00231250 [Dallia pectoralis]
MAGQQPFFNPTSPFTGCIQGSLCVGKTITLTGRVLPGAQRFHVNLQCGSNGSPDIALHLNPRYDGVRDVVVCNSLINSTWGPEQRELGSALTRGSSFTLMFLVNQNEYSVIINGSHLMNYMHRLPFFRVNTISVGGGVEIQSIAFSNPAGFQVRQKQRANRPWKSVQKSPPLMYQVSQQACSTPSFSPGLFQAPPPYTAQTSTAVPYKNIMPGGFYPGKNIAVQGTVNYNAEKFMVNLRFNSGLAFHFNPRFTENVVVRNSFLKERWGPEERTGGMPFYKGQPFMLTIICDTQCYRIIVNGAEMFTYKHRHFLFQEIDILEVDGDVVLSSVNI